MARRSLRDRPVRTIRNRGVTRGGRGRTSGVRKDDLADARDKRKPQGVTSPIKDAAKDVSKQPSPKPKPPSADKMDTKTPVTKPNVGKQTADKPKPPPEVTKRPRVTGKGDRNVSREGPMGKRTLANVTREQLVAAGLTTGPKGLRTYLNMFDKLGRRPKPSDFGKGSTGAKVKNKTTGAFEKMGMTRGGTVKKKSKGYAKGGMKTKGMKRGGMKAKGMAKGGMKAKGMARGGMKSKGMAKGGMKAKGMAKGGMKTKGYMAGGLKDVPEDNKGLKKLPKKVRNKMGFMAKGGMKSKGYAKGGMKSKMASKGEAKGGKKRVSKPKVRGAGIARKGVRPVKFR